MQYRTLSESQAMIAEALVKLADDSRARLEVEATALQIQTETLRVLQRIAGALETGPKSTANTVRNPIRVEDGPPPRTGS